MKVNGTIPKKTKPGKHKCHIPFKKVGWPEDHKTVIANKRLNPGILHSMTNFMSWMGRKMLNVLQNG